MALHVENRNGIPIVRIVGHLTDEHVDDLIATATEQLDKPGARLIMDLAEMVYVNSSGLGGLIRLAAQANAQQQRVVLSGPTDFVRDLFSLTRLDKFLETTATVAEAVEKIQKPR